MHGQIKRKNNTTLIICETNSIAKLFGKVISVSSINLILKKLEMNSNLVMQDFSKLAKTNAIYMAFDNAFNKLRYELKHLFQLVAE